MTWCLELLWCPAIFTHQVLFHVVKHLMSFHVKFLNKCNESHDVVMLALNARAEPSISNTFLHWRTSIWLLTIWSAFCLCRLFSWLQPSVELHDLKWSFQHQFYFLCMSHKHENVLETVSLLLVIVSYGSISPSWHRNTGCTAIPQQIMTASSSFYVIIAGKAASCLSRETEKPYVLHSQGYSEDQLRTRA